MGRAPEIQRHTGNGMLEGKMSGVQHGTLHDDWQRAIPSSTPVHGITHDGRAEVREMNAYLMGASGLNAGENQRGIFETLLNLIVGGCRLAVFGHHGHAHSIAWIASNLR